MRPAITLFRKEYFFLSNMSPVGNTTLEHQFQAGKTLDDRWKEWILGAKTPFQAKKLAHSAPMRPDWNRIKVDWMLQLLRWKFSQEPLRGQLLATEDAELIEGNLWHDNFWGSCTCQKCKDLPKENHLGRLLMQVRSELRTT